VESDGRPDNPPLRKPVATSACVAGVDGHGVLHGPPGRYWPNQHHGFALHQLWRGRRPGHSSEPIGTDAESLARHEAEVICSTGRSGESDGQDLNGHGNDTQPGDSPIAGPAGGPG
jgi:hypothetical protein